MSVGYLKSQIKEQEKKKLRDEESEKIRKIKEQEAAIAEIREKSKNQLQEIETLQKKSKRQEEEICKFQRELKEKIDNLPQTILEKAFRGELVEQNPNDEPAEVLLEKIKSEKKIINEK